MATALLLMDFRHGIAGRFESPAAVDRAGEALAAAREADLRVIFVRVGFRPGYPEVSVLCEISTSGVVLSTLRHAADLDYAITVLVDACLDSDEEVHRVLTEKVFPRQADVVDVADWVASL